ncbi:hypothetical protein [Puia dinghuensis]|uniref:Peptidase MA-like domain-containing protein n=1 Tax=Puia dinghuensis TaxID=1792502 RepID=A0A8J2XT67_9BACT|nr:hypothetical protein [Puia dinghuensis]GGB00988.1 hypothetical protein GCM10011511_25380 [Puia dinghuensis]
MKICLTTIFFVFLVKLLPAQATIPVEKYLGMLRDGNYRDVFEDILKLKKSRTYTKSAILDYFEAKCLCLNGTCESAYAIFTKMFQCYSFTDDQKDFLYKEMMTCQGTQAPSSGISSTVVTIPAQIPLPTATLHGKLGIVTNCYDQSQFVDFSHMPSGDDLAKRVFDKGQKARALAVWHRILGKGYTIDTSSDRFLIVTYEGEQVQEIRNAISALHKAASFYGSYYHLSPPDKLITVIMMPDGASLRAAAKKVHLLDLPAANLGYSSLADLSLLGIGDPEHIGTIFHELFHLMIRSDIGDIPVWLDEGLACLYSTYAWRGDTLIGAATWRTTVLQRANGSQDYAMKLPGIKLLTAYSWSEFNGVEDGNICKAAVNYAMANHLMLYFQQRNWLQKIVAAFRERPDPEFGSSTTYPATRQLLEAAIGEPLDSLQSEFSAWMEKTFRIYLSSYNMQPPLYPFQTIIDVSATELATARIYGMPADSAHSYDSQLRQIDAEYRQQFAASPDLKAFYLAEENRREGIYDPFTRTDSFRRMKQLYDRLTTLAVRIRAGSFKKG